MSILAISFADLSNCFMQTGHIIHETDLNLYTFVDKKSNTFAVFDLKHNLCTVYNRPGRAYQFATKDFDYALDKYKPHVYTIKELNDCNNSMEPDTRLEEKGHTHPNNYQIPALEGLTNWVYY